LLQLATILGHGLNTTHKDLSYTGNVFLDKLRTGSRLAAVWNVDITDVIHAGHGWFRPVEELRLVELVELPHIQE